MNKYLDQLFFLILSILILLVILVAIIITITNPNLEKNLIVLLVITYAGPLIANFLDNLKIKKFIQDHSKI